MDDDLFQLSSDLRLACMRISRHVRTQSSGELPQHQYAVLVELEERGPHTLSQLSEREGVAAPVMTRNVNLLEDLGYVRREPGAADRRQVTVVITPEGVTKKHLIKRNRDQWMAQRISSLSTDEVSLLRTATALLERIERM